jgi:hypothetical protein
MVLLLIGWLAGVARLRYHGFSGLQAFCLQNSQIDRANCHVLGNAKNSARHRENMAKGQYCHSNTKVYCNYIWTMDGRSAAFADRPKTV